MPVRPVIKPKVVRKQRLVDPPLIKRKGNNRPSELDLRLRRQARSDADLVRRQTQE